MERVQENSRTSGATDGTSVCEGRGLDVSQNVGAFVSARFRARFLFSLSLSLLLVSDVPFSPPFCSEGHSEMGWGYRFHKSQFKMPRNPVSLSSHAKWRQTRFRFTVQVFPENQCRKVGNFAFPEPKQKRVGDFLGPPCTRGSIVFLALLHVEVPPTCYSRGR